MITKANVIAAAPVTDQLAPMIAKEIKAVAKTNDRMLSISF